MSKQILARCSLSFQVPVGVVRDIDRGNGIWCGIVDYSKLIGIIELITSSRLQVTRISLLQMWTLDLEN